MNWNIPEYLFLTSILIMCMCYRDLQVLCILHNICSIAWGALFWKCSLCFITRTVHMCTFQKLCHSLQCSADFNLVSHSYRAWHLDRKLLASPALWCPRWEWQFCVSSSCWFLHVPDNDYPVAGKRQKPLCYVQGRSYSKLSIITNEQLISTNSCAGPS